MILQVLQNEGFPIVIEIMIMLLIFLDGKPVNIKYFLSLFSARKD